MRAAAALCLLVALGGATRAGAGAAPDDWLGGWRITRGVPAPWIAGDPQRPATALVGQRLVFGLDAVNGPGVLGCSDARYGATRMPPEGLFQGGLPAPAGAAAQALGFAGFPVDGFSLACSGGLFEFHAADADTLLFALDNVIWTLGRAAGALAAAGSPEAAVRVFLEAHFAGSMGFGPDSVAPKRAHLSRALVESIDAYLARPRPAEEVPPIDGDPFTDSQEYPARFAVHAGHATATGFEVPVEFADAWRRTRLDYLLVREGDAWRIDDLPAAHGTLGELLAQ
jgi:hypothetical protein